MEAVPGPHTPGFASRRETSPFCGSRWGQIRYKHTHGSNKGVRWVAVLVNCITVLLLHNKQLHNLVVLNNSPFTISRNSVG